MDFSNSALEAASKGFDRLQKGVQRLKALNHSDKSTIDISLIKEKIYSAMNDDFNSPIAIASMFDGLKIIAAIENGKETISSTDLAELQNLYNQFFFDILGLELEESSSETDEVTDELMELILDFRKAAKEQKDWSTADKIRDKLKKLNIGIKDSKDGATWEFEN